MMDGVMHLVTAGVKKNNCGVVCCLKKSWFCETMVAQMWRKMYGSSKLARGGFVQWGKVGKAASVSLALPNA